LRRIRLALNRLREDVERWRKKIEAYDQRAGAFEKLSAIEVKSAHGIYLRSAVFLMSVPFVHRLQRQRVTGRERQRWLMELALL
jgi:hypothetical protein